MPVTWNHFHGSPNYSYLLSFAEALGNGGANFVGATSSAATFASGPHQVILKGQLVIGLGGQPDSGLVDTVEIYQGDVLVAKGTGYQLGIDAIGEALDVGQNHALGKIFFLDQHLVINGSKDGDELFSGNFNGRAYGNGGDDEIVGGGRDDAFYGGAGNDGLLGLDGNDLIKGGKGKDLLFGGDGDDLLIGNKGRDSFRFDAPLDPETNVDKIKKFSHAKDTIELSASVFLGLDQGPLKGRYFHDGKKAKDGNDHVLYDDGRLLYDSDGKGGAEPVLFAKLKGDPDIAADDFLLI